MSDTHDELLARLRQADPVDAGSLPSSADPEAQRLLAAAMAKPPPAEFSADAGAGFGSPPPVETTTGRKGRRWGRLTAVAAAVLVLVMGAIVFSPSNTEPALAAVQNAADTTAGTDTGRVTTTFALTGSDGASADDAQIAGRVEVTFAGRDLAFALEVSDISGPTGAGTSPLPLDEGRYVDDIVYANVNGQWIALEAPGLITDAALDIADPRTILVTVQELLEVEELGQTTIDGVDVTHYRSMVDLGDASLGQAGLLAGLETQLDLDAEGEVVIDLYVDDLDRMYRVDVSGDIQEPDGNGTASFELSTVFTDLDADLRVDAPANAIVLDLSNLDELPQGLLEDD